MVLRIKNKSLDTESIITSLGNFKVIENTIVDVPSYFTECQVREAIRCFPNLVLLGGYVVNADDIEYGNILNHEGVMTKDVYDKDYNNIVDNVEGGGGTGQNSLAITFDFSDFVNISKNIGTVLSGLGVYDTSIEIINAFDSGSISVGDDLNNSRFMDYPDSDIRYKGTYESSINHIYNNNALIKLFMVGSPSTGSGIITVHVD